MSGAGEPTVTLTLAQSDWQLVMQVLQQALLPYQRLGQVMQGMQQQAARAAQSEQAESIQRGGRPHPIEDEPGLMRRDVRP